jgi:hypothetical protein
LIVRVYYPPPILEGLVTGVGVRIHSWSPKFIGEIVNNELGVPDYLVGQTIEYIKSRGYSPKQFTPKQIEDEKFMMNLATYPRADVKPEKGYEFVRLELTTGKYWFYRKKKEE